MVNQKLKTQETRCRRMAKRQYLTVVKSRRRDPRAVGFGTYGVVTTRTGEVVYAIEDGVGLNLDQVEHFLRTGRKSKR